MIKNLKIKNIFKDKNEKEGNSVTDKLIMEVLQLLKLVAIMTRRIAENAVGQV